MNNMKKNKKVAFWVNRDLDKKMLGLVDGELLSHVNEIKLYNVDVISESKLGLRNISIQNFNPTDHISHL